MKKRILIVSASFYPENSPRSFRTTELAKELARQGHEVVLYTTKQNKVHENFEAVYGILIKDFGKLRFKSLGIKSPGKFALLFSRIFNRLLLTLFEYPSIGYFFLVKKAIKYESGYDQLISIAVPFPVHWGVAAARSQKNLIARLWIADCGDPYMGCKTDSFKKLFYFKYVEKWFCKKADFITVPTEASVQGYYKEFHKKIRVIPQGFNLNEFSPLQNFKKNLIPKFVYAGNFIPGVRDPSALLKYLSEKNIDFRFTIFTQPQWKPMLAPFQQLLQDKLIVKDYLPRNELLGVLSTSDFLVNFSNNTSIQTPSKLIDYALSGRPVLGIDQNLDTVAVDGFLEGNYSRKLSLNSLDKYDIKSVAKQFIEIK